MRKIISLLVIISALVNCSDKKNEKSPNIITISEVHTVPTVKKGLDVVIDSRLDTLQLENLGKIIYEQNDGKDYKNFFINYYLPRMVNGNFSYASTHFTPDLDIQVLGMTQQHINDMEHAINTSRPFWLDESCQCFVKIKNKKGKLAIHQVSYDMNTKQITLDILDVIPKIISNDSLFYINKSTVGEYYKYNIDNDMERYDEQGFIDKLLKF